VLSPASKQQLEQLTADLTCGKSLLVKHYTRWCIKGPNLGANGALVAMVLEELGHANILKKVQAEQGWHGQGSNDAFAYLRRTSETWIQLVANLYVLDGFFYYVLNQLLDSGYAPLSGNLPKILAEEIFHHQFAEEWFGLLKGSPNLGGELAKEVNEALNDVLAWSRQLRTDALVQEGLLGKKLEELGESFVYRIREQLV
jgi:1,2-phenylacetyl-CoA epoxidase catalytic subunit